MLNKRQLMAVSLLAATVASWAYIASPASNYVHYYTALEQLGIDIPSMSLVPSGNNLTVNLAFLVSNPTGYVGLEITSLTYTARVPDGASVVALGVGYIDSTPPAPLRPQSSIKFPTSFILSGLDMTQYTRICSSSDHMLSWSFDGSAGLGTRDGILVHQFHLPVAKQC